MIELYYRPQTEFAKVMFLPAATKLGQGNVFTGVRDSVHVGGVCIPACIAGGIPACLAAGLQWGGVCIPACLAAGLQWGGVCIPACIQVQAHTQGGNGGGSGPGPHPRGKLRKIRSRPTPKGEIEGDQVQAHTQGGN